MGALSLALWAGACSHESATGPATSPWDAASLDLSAPASPLSALGDTVRLTAVARDATGKQLFGVVSWSTSDTTVVVVDDGLVRAVGNGTAYIRVAAKPLHDSVSVVVRQVLDPHQSTVTVTPGRAFHLDTVRVRLQARDARGHPLPDGGATVAFSAGGGTSVGEFLPVRDNQDGTYDAPFVVEGLGSPLVMTATAGGQPVTTAPPTLEAVGFTRIAAAGQFIGTQSGGFTCGIITTGDMYCWGISWQGVRGNGDPGLGLEPNRIPTLVSGGHDWVDVAAGAYYACGVTTAGRGYCWGGGSQGQIGIGESGSLPAVTVPTLLHTDSTLARVFSGVSDGPCALTTGHRALCWGDNLWGRLGIGADFDFLATVPTPVVGGLEFAALSTTWSGACGVTTDGAAYCWGPQSTLGLGGPTAPTPCTGGANCSTTPLPVSGGILFRPVIAHAGNVVCAVATTGQTYCWGGGYLGTGRVDVSVSPTPVAGNPEFAALTGGDSFHCGITNVGAALCWGANQDGVLGNGSTTAATVPEAVLGNHRFVQLSAARDHVCGIAVDGNAWCWGGNDKGELGNRSLTSSTTPVRVRLFIR